VAGGNATNASRGSNALPAAASLTILMNWFRQPAEGQTQQDHRVILKTQGRAKGSTLLIELHDDGWIHHGDGEAVLGVRRCRRQPTICRAERLMFLTTSTSAG